MKINRVDTVMDYENKQMPENFMLIFDSTIFQCAHAFINEAIRYVGDDRNLKNYQLLSMRLLDSLLPPSCFGEGSDQEYDFKA